MHKHTVTLKVVFTANTDVETPCSRRRENRVVLGKKFQDKLVTFWVLFEAQCFHLHSMCQTRFFFSYFLPVKIIV